MKATPLKAMSRMPSASSVTSGILFLALVLRLRQIALGSAATEHGHTLYRAWLGRSRRLQVGDLAKRQRPVWAGKASILKRAMGAALAEHGKTRRPFGSEGPEVRAVDRERVRAEFYASYSADGASQETKRRNFNRLIDGAQEKNLIAARFDDGVDWLWFASKADEEPTG